MSCRPHRFGPGPWPARTGAGDADFVQDRLELRGVAALSGGEHNRHGLLPLLDGQVELGGQATARAAKAMVVRLDGDAAGRLGLQVPFSRPGRVLVGPADRGAGVDVPADESLGIGLGLQLGEDPLPAAVPLPAAE